METESDTALTGALRVLSHPKRLRLLRYLKEPHYLEEMARELGIARQSAQEHVEQLLEAGMIEPRRGRREHGPVTEYVVSVSRLFALHEDLGANLGVLEVDREPAMHALQRTTPLDARTPPGAIEDLPRLTIVHGMRIGETTVLEGAGPWLVGRDPNALVSIDYDPFVSGRHAEIRRTPDGFAVTDAFSSNGTFLDWVRMPRGGTAALRNGSLLRIGKSLILFRGPR